MSSPAPWWKFGHVWLILSGPAIVVLASLFTLYLAVTRPDQLVAQDADRRGAASEKSQIHPAPDSSLAPALQARNHAATGVVPAGKP